MDKRTVFADGLVLARCAEGLDRGVLVAEPPNVWLIAGHQRRPARGSQGARHQPVRAARRQRRAQREQLLWALDNWIYTAEVDIQLRLKNGKFEVQQDAVARPVGRHAGRRGPDLPEHERVGAARRPGAAPYFARHPNLLRTRGSYESPTGPNGELNDVWPVRPTRGTNRGYQFGILTCRRLAREVHVGVRADGVPRRSAAGRALRQRLRRRAGRQSRQPHHSRATTATALRGREGVSRRRGEFLASTDERFRPVHLSLAPDGTLYVVDMYRGIIQHRGYITEYLRDYILTHKLEQPTAFGRIYRVVHETHRSATRRRCRCEPHRAAGGAAVASERLVARHGAAAARRARRHVGRAGAAEAGVERRRRARAPACALDARRSRRDRAGDVMRALADANTGCARVGDPIVGAMAGRGRTTRSQAAVLKRLDDTDWAVRRQLAASLGELPAGAKEAALAAHPRSARRRSDRGRRGAERRCGAASWRCSIDCCRRATETPQRAAAITMLAATIVRGARTRRADAVAARGGTARAAWQRSRAACGARRSRCSRRRCPATPRRGAGDPNAPCETCPGGRGGPGGARAFPGALEGADPPAPPARAGGPFVRCRVSPR